MIKLVARHALMHRNQRLTNALRLVVILGFVSQLLISYKLWWPVGRTFPKVPATDFLSFDLGLAGDAVLSSLLVVALLLLLVKRLSKYALWSVIVLFIVLIFEDITRLQTWVWMSMLLLVALSDGHEKDEEPHKRFRLVVGGAYLWSGIHKLNIYFAGGIFPWMVQPFGMQESFAEQAWIGYVAAGIEALIGIMLLVGFWRNMAALGGIGMHLVILLCIGPLGHDFSPVIWPWNIALMVCLFLLLNHWRKAPKKNTSKAVLNFRNPLNLGLGVFTLLMPMLFFFGIWDANLSFGMFTGVNNEATLLIDGDQANHFDASVRPFIQFDPQANSTSVKIDYWIADDLGVPFYAENRFYRKLMQQYCRWEWTSASVVIYSKTPMATSREIHETTIACAGE